MAPDSACLCAMLALASEFNLRTKKLEAGS
jgi:hypothetical protein